MTPGGGLATLIGRAGELAAVTELLDRARQGRAALAITGEAGTGKSALLDEAATRALDVGWRVLRCRGAESEAAFAFGALTDLLTPVASELDEWLPEPRRRALQVAMLRADAGGDPVEPHAVARAVAEGLVVLSAGAPVLLVVDDAQWLDPESANALRFALRRCEDAHLAVLSAWRADVTDTAPLTEGDTVLRPASLSPDEIEHLLAQHGFAMPRATLRRIQQTAGGHPLYALELARHFATDPTGAVPRSLVTLLEDRVRQLPDDALPVLAAAALLATPTRTLVRAAVGDSDIDVDRSVDAAIDAGIVTEASGAVRFAHPLLAEAAAATAASGWRRAVHRRLAEVLEDPEQRAVHLGLAATEPDEPTAALIEEGAARARSRGAAEVAADLIAAAVRLTPAVEIAARRRRRIDGAYHHVAAGRPAAAADLIRAALADDTDTTDGRERAELEWRAAMMQFLAGDLVATIELLESARARTPDEAVRQQVSTRLANMYMWTGRFARGVEIADGIDADALSGNYRINAVSTICLADFVSGRSPRLDPWQAVVDFENLLPPAPAHENPIVRVVHQLALSRPPADVADVAAAALARAVDDTDDLGIAWLSATAGYAQLLAGRWDAAVAAADDGVRAARRADSSPALAISLAAAASVHACRGDAVATDLANEMIALGTRQELLSSVSHVLLGFVAMSAGDADGALQHFGTAAETFDAALPDQPAFPSLRWHLTDALLDAGALDEAARRLEHLASLEGHPLAEAVAATGRGRLAALRGDRDAGDAAFDQALRAHERLGWPFDRAITLYRQGCALHDQQRRGLARTALTEARDVFASLGAAAWEARAATALAGISGRSPSPGVLTRAEEEVAGLAAAGLTNRQIAERLFVSPKTVATHLGHVYAKLGLRSRTELAARARRLRD